MAKRRPGRPKSKTATKQATIIVRVLRSERRAFERAAAASRKRLSAWIRAALLAASRPITMGEQERKVEESNPPAGRSPEDVKSL
jgi:hypothetical protein